MLSQSSVMSQFNQSIHSKYNIFLTQQFQNSLQSHFPSNPSLPQLNKEFLYSNFYQSVDGKTLRELNVKRWRDGTAREEGGVVLNVPIASQQDIASLDRLTILTPLTLQIDEIQDVSVPQMELVEQQQDDVDELDEEDEDMDEEQEDQLRLFRSHLEKNKSGGTGENANGGMYRKRMLKMALTNGYYRFYGVEFEPLYSKMPNIPPVGTKILVQNVHVRRGCLMLTSQSLVQMLGGLSEDLMAIEREKRSALKKR